MTIISMVPELIKNISSTCSSPLNSNQKISHTNGNNNKMSNSDDDHVTCMFFSCVNAIHKAHKKNKTDDTLNHNSLNSNNKIEKNNDNNNNSKELLPITGYNSKEILPTIVDNSSVYCIGDNLNTETDTMLHNDC